MAAASAILEGLTERNGDGDGAVTLLPVQGHAEVNADRAEARIVTRADAGREMPVLDVRHGFGRQRAAIEEGHDAKVAAELLEANARLDRELHESATADRIAIRVLGAEPLIPVTANRTAASGIEAPGRCDVEGGCAENRTEPHPASGDHAIGEGMVGARIELDPAVGKLAAMGGDFRADPAAQAKPAGRIEQAVAAVIAKAGGQSRDEEGARVLEAGKAEDTA